MEITREQYGLLKRILAKSCTRSEVGNSDRKWLDHLAENTALVRKERARGGVRYHADIGLAGLLNALVERYETPDEAIDALSEKAQNLFAGHDTKKRRTAQLVMYLHLKALQKRVQARSSERVADLSAMTEGFGVAGLEVTPGDLWQFERDGSPATLLLVENSQLFVDTGWIEAIGTQADVLVQYGGVLSGPLLQWLSEGRFARIVHFPDYDGVGLREHLRLISAVTTIPVEFLLLEDFRPLLTRFGSAKVFLKKSNFDAFYQASEVIAGSSELAHLAPLVSAMRTHGKALEQEGVELAGFTGDVA